MVVSQALINLGVVLGMMPTKGIPLPFMSYGGSSLFVMLLATGVLLNISQQRMAGAIVKLRCCSERRQCGDATGGRQISAVEPSIA